MEKQHLDGNSAVRPNMHAYNAVINACAFTAAGDDQEGTAERLRAFQIAQDVLHELCESEYDRPSPSSFGTFLKACGRLSLPPDVVEKNVEEAFRTCCDMGLVNDFVLTQIRYSAPNGLYQTLLGDWATPRTDGRARVEVSEIPFEWRRHTSERGGAVGVGVDVDNEVDDGRGG